MTTAQADRRGPRPAAPGLDRIRASVAAHGLTLLRAWPRDPGHLLLHVSAPADAGEWSAGQWSRGQWSAGQWSAGQWFADDDRAAEVARICRPGAAGPAQHLAGTGVVLQPGGAEHRLRLAGLVRCTGSVLVAHRPGRRAVVRHGSGAADEGSDEVTWTKVVRPSRLTALAAAASWRPRGVTVPEVLDIDPARGTLRSAALPGVPLHALGGPGAAATTGAWEQAGRVVARLHAATPPPTASHHGVDEELAVTSRWLRHAVEHGALAAGTAAALAAEASSAAASLRADPRVPPLAPLHRDLHDKQVLVGPAGAGLLDLDLVAVGDPALDVANLLVHLLLRDEQAAAAGRPLEQADARGAAFLAGYGVHEGPTAARLHAWAVLAAVRVAAVYAFRAPVPMAAFDTIQDLGGPGLGLRLVERVTTVPPGGLPGGLLGGVC